MTEDRYYPVAAPEYEVTLQTLAEKPLFDCANMYSNWTSWAEEAGLNWPNPRVTYATTYTVTLEIAEAGGGVAMAHDTVARKRIADRRLVAPFEQHFPMEEGYYLITGRVPISCLRPSFSPTGSCGSTGRQRRHRAEPSDISRNT